MGTEDQPDTINARDIDGFIRQGGQYDPLAIDPMSRARTIAFQTWIGVGDTQVLVNATNGQVMSIDHGECFQSVAGLADPAPLISRSRACRTLSDGTPPTLDPRWNVSPLSQTASCLTRFLVSRVVHPGIVRQSGEPR